MDRCCPFTELTSKTILRGKLKISIKLNCYNISEIDIVLLDFNLVIDFFDVGYFLRN